MDLKKIITFLGTGNYQETTYERINQNNEKISVTTRFVQEAIREVIDKGVILYVGLTDEARKRNWLSGPKEIKDSKTCEVKKVFQEGLKDILDNKGILYREFSLQNGKNEEEMWQNFESIFNILDEEDEVYVDVTHSFRSIPFIIMSALNYARFVKNIDIKGIYYGAFEAKTVDNVTPIFDLSLFNQLSDWTIGAEKFLNTGDSKQLSNMINTTIKPILKETEGKDEDAKISRQINKDLEDFSGGLYTVRGNKISEYGVALKKSLESIKRIELNELKPFEKILDKIYEKVYFYSDDIVSDVHNTVKLCRDFRLIQQAYTFLRENIVNYLCVKGEIDIRNTKDRELIETVLLSRHNLKKEKIVLKDDHKAIEVKIKDYVNYNLAELFEDLSSDYRNDLNHGGYRQDSKEYKKFSKKLDDFILGFERLIFNDGMEMEMIH